MPWKAKKTKEIKGPAVTAGTYYSTRMERTNSDSEFFQSIFALKLAVRYSDNSSKATKEQRDKLGLSSNGKGQSNPREYAEPASAMDKVQVCGFARFHTNEALRPLNAVGLIGFSLL